MVNIPKNEKISVDKADISKIVIEKVVQQLGVDCKVLDADINDEGENHMHLMKTQEIKQMQQTKI